MATTTLKTSNGVKMLCASLLDNGALVDRGYSVITLDGEEIYAGPDRAEAERQFEIAARAKSSHHE